MAYVTQILCDMCGAGYRWTDTSVSLSIAKSIARSEGWRVGKQGWFCPECLKTGGKRKNEGKSSQSR